jgi:hypothetical protein
MLYVYFDAAPWNRLHDSAEDRYIGRAKDLNQALALVDEDNHFGRGRYYARNEQGTLVDLF